MGKGIKLDAQALEYAVIGGSILGGGGGGSMDMGRTNAKIAVEYKDLYLIDINDLNDDDYLICASMVGAPKAPEQYLMPEHLVRSVELFKKNTDAKIAGIITNENGGVATVNGWVQAAMAGIPLIDAPCNGRAHPTGVMGSMNLHKNPDYVTMQAAVGGNPATGKYIECVVKGTVDHTAKLVRSASIEAGGIVTVVRNPVTVAYAKQNCAIGGISHAIETGKVFLKGLEQSPERAVHDVAEFLGGEICAKGTIDNFTLKTEGGFDVGEGNIGSISMTFWNEYMTLDNGDKRLYTFPDLIMTFDANTGYPVTTAEIEAGQEVYIVGVPMANLKLSSTMYEADLIEQVEEIVGKNMVKYFKK